MVDWMGWLVECLEDGVGWEKKVDEEGWMEENVR